MSLLKRLQEFGKDFDEFDPESVDKKTALSFADELRNLSDRIKKCYPKEIKPQTKYSCGIGYQDSQEEREYSEYVKKKFRNFALN